jgi:hypothetical protein
LTINAVQEFYFRAVDTAVINHFPFFLAFFSLCATSGCVAYMNSQREVEPNKKTTAKPIQASFLIFILNSPKKYPLPQHMSDLPSRQREQVGFRIKICK